MFRVTYDIVTPESAERGDYAECGFVDPNGWHSSEAAPMRLRQALRLCFPQEDCGGWFGEVDGHTNYTTGAVETRALHPPRNITASSYARLRRVLGFEG